MSGALEQRRHIQWPHSQTTSSVRPISTPSRLEVVQSRRRGGREGRLLAVPGGISLSDESETPSVFNHFNDICRHTHTNTQHTCTTTPLHSPVHPKGLLLSDLGPGPPVDESKDVCPNVLVKRARMGQEVASERRSSRPSGVRTVNPVNPSTPLPPTV